MAAINSITPLPIRPHGSIPSLENIYTDSSDAENLKKSVCNIMSAGNNLSAQIPIVFQLMVILLIGFC
jgi:hypothetical protein